MLPSDGGWSPPVVRTIGTTGEGAADVIAAVQRHRDWLSAGGGLERRRAARTTDELRSILVERLLDRVRHVQHGDAFERACASVLAREVDPWTATDQLLEAL